MDMEHSFDASEYCISAQDAALLLKQLNDIPTFGAAVSRLYPHADLREKLTAAFCCLDGVNPSSVDRRIRNWLNGKNAPQNREDIFVCAFALGLNEQDTSSLLGLCCDSKIHYRNPKELTYAFALRSGYSYEHAVQLYESLPDKDYGVTRTPTVYTTAVRRSFEPTADEAEFTAGFIAHLHILGEFHNKAYYYFRHYMSVLFSPEEGTENYSAERVIETYLSPHEDSGRCRRKLDKTQKLVRRAFPNATDLRSMIARRLDIPRKLLLLLYVVTENSFDDAYDERDEEYISADERFEQHWWGINLMLSDCGMPILDPQNPFDRLILYALNTEDADESMLERFDAIVAYLFDDEDDPPDDPDA